MTVDWQQSAVSCRLLDSPDVRFAEFIEHTTEFLGQWGRHGDIFTPPYKMSPTTG
jgi:hypothetical protein